VHVISRAPFDEAARHYPNDAAAIDDTYRVLKRVVAKKPDELKRYFNSLDRMKYREKWWVIDIGGNNLRMMFLLILSAERYSSNTLPPMLNMIA
jgi:mRNA interferase HigB